MKKQRKHPSIMRVEALGIDADVQATLRAAASVNAKRWRAVVSAADVSSLAVVHNAAGRSARRAWRRKMRTTRRTYARDVITWAVPSSESSSSDESESDDDVDVCDVVRLDSIASLVDRANHEAQFASCLNVLPGVVYVRNLVIVEDDDNDNHAAEVAYRVAYADWATSDERVYCSDDESTCAW